MEYFQSVLKHQRIILAGVILAFVLAIGCSTHKAENMSASDAAGEPAAASAPENAIPAITDIQVKQDADRLTVWVHGTAPMAYTSIKQAFPFAIAVYLPDTTLGPDLAPAAVDDPDIGAIHVGYADKEKTTAKLEILLKRDVPYLVKENDNSLEVILERNPVETDMPGQVPAGIPVAASGQAADPSTDPIPAAAAQPVQVPDTPAEMTQIEFETIPSGRSDIRVKTSHPVRYEARQISQGQINLVLFNTKVPRIHQRPLLTRYFNSAVEQIQPKPLPGAPENAYIEIRIRDQVPYQLVQTADGIHMAFDPSSVRPPVFDKAKVNMNQASSDQIPVSAEQGVSGQAVPASEPRNAPNDMFSNAPPVYTGEKIKLDFYDTDIKNVFRILRSVSGLNFAIDDDVQGKVTLSLEEPVPWDQVMDLVLKMNGLGKKMEGNVVRIATLVTMADEEKAIQAAFAARKKSMEQKESLAPLVTEYIPINYSDAAKDVQPHVAQILTPDRGRLSVDQRTNMIIITDTQAKIDQAQDLIYRLDTVTPQIMIEARVVEVTKEFSRNLGLKWNLTNASSSISGFVDDFNVAVNQPNTGIDADFTFFNFLGTSAALNAQLEASEELGDVRIVSSPRILTLDNKKAKIKQGLEYAYLERDDAGGSSVKFKDIDLLLEVTPHVTPDRRISMTVYLTKNDVAGVTTTGVPTLATNEAETELLVNNNDTVVIGGVVKTTKSEDTSGLPFLSGIPVLGQLFGTNQKTDNRNELLIFLTPSIVQLEQKRHISGAVN